MVALSSWIESEESAVADSFSYPGETATPSKNRVGDFFRETPNRVGEVGPQVVDRVGFLVVVELRPRQAASLARSSQLAKAQAAFNGLLEEHPELMNSIIEKNPDILVVDKIEITKQHTSGSTKVITPGGAYNAKTNTLTLVVGGKSTTMLTGVLIHEGTHIADSLAGMNISGADNYATELNAYRNQTAYLLKVHPGAKAPFIVKGAFNEGAFKTFYDSNRAAYGGRSEYRTIGRNYTNAHCFSVNECLGF